MKFLKTRAQVSLAFEPESLRISLSNILPLRQLTPSVLKSVKYAQIAASIAEVGIIEPPVVIKDSSDPDLFHLRDGHIRIDVLRKAGVAEVVCLVATADEAFTYNKRINRLAAIQEHKMILNAITLGAREERLARTLNVNINSIRSKSRLLQGICGEVSELLADRQVPINTFGELKKLKPLRQIEAAQLMIAMNRFSLPYAKSIVAATPDNQLQASKKRSVRGLTDEQISIMETETANLSRDFKVIEQDYGSNHLDLVLALGYVSRLLSNAKIVGYLAAYYPDILTEFQRVTELQKVA